MRLKDNEKTVMGLKSQGKTAIDEKRQCYPLPSSLSINRVTLSGETLSGEIFVTKRKIRHFRPTKNFAQ